MKTQFNHDICHCPIISCELKDTCYRYQAHLEAQKCQLDYLTYYKVDKLTKIGKDCKSYWPIK